LAFALNRAMNGVAMATFTIDSENNITAHVGLPAGADESQSFTNQKELAKLTTDWPMSRLIDTWNGFAGAAPFNDLRPVKKFTNRKAALARIWKAIERLAADVAKSVGNVAPTRGKAKKSPPEGERRNTARPGAKRGANVARDGSKKAEVIDLMRRPSGATLAEIMEMTSWQAHTVRGFVSGTLIKKLGLRVESFRNDEKERAYKIRS
jgi:hypothetical protein